jgi:hypothetical protein
VASVSVEGRPRPALEARGKRSVEPGILPACRTRAARANGRGFRFEPASVIVAR